MSLRFHLVVSDVDPGIKDFMCKRVGANIFSRVPREGSPLIFRGLLKKDVLGKGVWSVWNCGRRQKKIFDFVIWS